MSLELCGSDRRKISTSYSYDGAKGGIRRVRRRLIVLARFGCVALASYLLAIVWVFFLSSSSQRQCPQEIASGSISFDLPKKTKKNNLGSVCDRAGYPPYETLSEEQVTVLVNGFSEARIPLLASNMQRLSSSPAVHSIYILWGNTSSPDSIVKEEFLGTQGAPIYVVRQKSKSLNDRFLPRKFIATKVVVICDDDITVDHESLEFALKVWQQHQERIVGFFPRSHEYDYEDHVWVYRKHEERYSMMLTKFMLLSTEYLFKYTCQIADGVKEYIDKGRNCEDIAMNFLVSSLTGVGPLLVKGYPRDWGDTRNSEEKISMVGISAKKGHRLNRGACLADFAELWGGMPLRYSYYKAVNDMTEEVLCDKYGYLMNCDSGYAHSASEAKRMVGANILRKNFTYAYATLIGQRELMGAAMVLAQCLRATHTAHDLVLMVDVSGDVNVKDSLLLQHFDVVQPIKAVKNPYEVQGFNKLNAWLLVKYSKVIYIDVDTLVLSNLDHLFEHPEPTAVPDVYSSSKFNSGLLVLQPSKATFTDMVAKIPTLPSYNRGDQGFLNAYFSGWFQMPAQHRLPTRYNAVLFFPAHYNTPPWFQVDKAYEVMGPVAVAHFANPWFKPWSLSRNVSTNIWCSAWMSVSAALEKNGWRPLDEDFTPLEFVPEQVAYGRRGNEYQGGKTHVPYPVKLELVVSANKEAFVTVASDGAFFTTAIWATSLLSHHTFSGWRKTILLVPSYIPEDLWRPHARLFNRVMVVEPIRDPNGTLLDESFNVLHIFNLTEYTKVVYIDPLAFFLENCNALFDFDGFAAPPSPFPPDSFSTRVMVVQPDQGLFKDLNAKLTTLRFPPNSVDRFLNAYFYDWFEKPPLHRISPNYAVDMVFKHGLMKFLRPWKILVFDLLFPPWEEIADDVADDRVKVIKLWRRTLCSLEPDLRPVTLDHLCVNLEL